MRSYAHFLNAVTWMDDSEALAGDVRAAQHVGVHLQLCHEFPSVLDSGSARKALGFKKIMDSTPPDLTSGARNIYKEIAISLKGSELREVGLAALAAKLATRVPREPVADAGRRHTSRRFTSRRFTTQKSMDASSGFDNAV